MRRPTRARLDVAGLSLMQSKEIAFTLDAVLLANFASVAPGARVLDLGTGTGVIPLLLAAKTGASHVVGLEILPDLAEMARRNVEANGLSGHVEIRQGDLRRLEELSQLGHFDLVVANPPYYPVGSGRLSGDPARAAARHEVHATLWDYVAAAKMATGERGRFALVYPPARLQEAVSGLDQAVFGLTRLRIVYPRPGEKGSLVLLEAESLRAPGGGLAIEEPLIVYGSDGEYSEELRRVMDGSARLAGQ